MASKTEAGELGEPIPGHHVCPHCAKPFARLCDLNKHAKSHSRPFKCAIATCKYHEHGWPTAKELERHINDKHSAAPRTYACRFPPCTYKSKRESNCKQHMEKTHRWKYIRSKSNGKHMTSQHRDDLEPHHQIDISSPRACTTTTSSPAASLISPNQDFVLFPYNESPIVLGEDDDGDIGYDPQGQASQVYLPWTSPTTRIRRNENFIEVFTQTYNGAPERPIGNTDSLADSLIDSGLPQYTHSDLPFLGGSDPAGLYSTQALIKVEAPSTTAERLPLSKPKSRTDSRFSDDPRERRPLPVIQTAMCGPSQAGCEHLGFLGSSAPVDQTTFTNSKSALCRRRTEDDEDSEDEKQSPQKRPRSNPAEAFSDTDMPDIFRFAHPRIYDRDRKEKYSPCHSSHRDISTLVRHLARPAHRLQVTDRSISSFDVNDPEYCHPRLGLCRRCWLAFPERGDFKNHISQVCDKVSKGKREKWRILLDSFTPLDRQPGDSEQPDRTLGSDRVGSGVGSRRPSNFEDFSFSTQRKGKTWADHSTSPVPAQPSAIPGPGLDMATATLSGPAFNTGFVPISEHMNLQREHRELYQEHRVLCQKHQQLVQATKALFPQTDQDTLSAGSQKPDGAFFALRAGQAHRGHGSNGKDTASDQESLVLHMDSQSTDVDIQGLMNEAPETLSRHNSGLTSMSHSTIHHVPTSPPPLASDDASDCENESGEAQESGPSRRPPPSIPDSGYGTDPRRCSLGEQGGQIPPRSGHLENADPSQDRFSQHLHESSSSKLDINEISLHRTRPVVVGPSGDEAVPIAWGNPWGGGAPAATNTQTSTTMAHHTFVNEGPAAEPQFDFLNMNMDLEHFEIGMFE